MFNLFTNKVKTTVIEELDENELKEFCKKNESETNVILSQNIKLGHNSQSTFRNANVICIGNAGSGKTRQFVIPNIIACNANYVITDHRNEIFDACEETLRNNGYEIEVIDYKIPNARIKPQS